MTDNQPEASPHFSGKPSPELDCMRGLRTSPDDTRRVNADIVGNYVHVPRPDDGRTYDPCEPGNF